MGIVPIIVLVAIIDWKRCSHGRISFVVAMHEGNVFLFCDDSVRKRTHEPNLCSCPIASLSSLSRPVMVIGR